LGTSSKGLAVTFSAARWCCVMPTSSVGGSNTPLVPKQHHRVAFLGYICPASNPMHLGRSHGWLRTMGRRSIPRALGMPGIKSDAPWTRSWMTATHGLPLGVHTPGARRVWRNSYSVFRYAAQAKPQAQARPTTPSNGARVQVKPHAGGEAPDQAPVAPPGRCRAGSQGAGADGSGVCGAPPWSENVLTGTPGGPGGATLPANHG